MSPPPSLLSDFSTCALSDALISLGHSHGGYIPDIHPIFATERISGPAYTVKFLLASDPTTASPTFDPSQDHFLDQVPAGSIIFVQAPLGTKNAVWGSLMSAAAKSKGALGVIISGRCRDLAELRALELPLFARGNSTVGQRPFTRPWGVDIPLVIEPSDGRESENGEGKVDFPAVSVNPGDIIVADEDGVVCVPSSLASQVMEIAKKAQEIDERCMQDILDGKGVKETFKKHRGK